MRSWRLVRQHLDAHLVDLRRRNRRQSTIKQRAYALGRLERYTGKDLLEVTRDELTAYTDRFTEPESRATEISHIRQFYRWAVVDGWLDHDPSAWLVRPKLGRKLPRPMPDESLAAAIAFAPTRVKPMLLLAAYAGLRAVDMASLRAGDLWWHEQIIVLPDSKGGHEDSQPLPPALAAELQRCDLPERGWLFPYADARPSHLPPHRISQLANGYLHSMGIPETLHQIRHWFGTKTYIVSDGDQRATQELLRHQDPKSTARYTYIDPGRLADIAAKLPPLILDPMAEHPTLPFS